MNKKGIVPLVILVIVSAVIFVVVVYANQDKANITFLPKKNKVECLVTVQNDLGKPVRIVQYSCSVVGDCVLAAVTPDALFFKDEGKVVLDMGARDSVKYQIAETQRASHLLQVCTDQTSGRIEVHGSEGIIDTKQVMI